MACFAWWLCVWQSDGFLISGKNMLGLTQNLLGAFTGTLTLSPPHVHRSLKVDNPYLLCRFLRTGTNRPVILFMGS